MPRSHNGKTLSFRKSVVDAFWDHLGTSSFAFEAKIITPDGEQTDMMFKCITCKRWHQYSAIQLGHIVEWKAYFDQKGVTTKSSWTVAMEVFNDLSNLAPQCATCNTSHDWEKYYFEDEDDTEFEAKYGDDSEQDIVDDDGNLVDEDFIVPDDCPTCGAAYIELFNHLACNKCRTQFCLKDNKTKPFDNKLVCAACGDALRKITENDFMNTLEAVAFPSDRG